MQTPKQLALLYEVNAMYRQIFTDGRPFPEDPTPTWNGYRLARGKAMRWSSRTQGFRDDLGIDTGGSPISDIAKMTERITRPNYGTLNIDLTIDNPKNYTKPFTVNLSQHIELDTELVDEFCLENEKLTNGCSDREGWKRRLLREALSSGATEAAPAIAPPAGRVRPMPAAPS